MKLITQLNKNSLKCSVELDGRKSVNVDCVLSPDLPAFKSDDMWLAEIHTSTDTLRVEPVRIWINPETGEIKVTLLGVPRRQPFSIVNRWLIKLETK